jgi:hypothetical protein
MNHEFRISLNLPEGFAESKKRLRANGLTFSDLGNQIVNALPARIRKLAEEGRVPRIRMCADDPSEIRLDDVGLKGQYPSTEIEIVAAL